jgi:hypothetical protein
MALMMSGVFLGLGIPISLSLELKRVCDIYPGHFAPGDTHMFKLHTRLVEHKDETLIVILLVALFVLVSTYSLKASLTLLQHYTAGLRPAHCSFDDDTRI